MNYAGPFVLGHVVALGYTEFGALLESQKNVKENTKMYSRK